MPDPNNVIDMSGDDGVGRNDDDIVVDLSEGSQPEGGTPPAPEGNEPPKAGNEPKKFVEVYKDFADLEDFKEMSLEDGISAVKDIMSKKKSFAEQSKLLESDLAQIKGMSDLLNKDQDLAKFVWDAIDRRRNGKPLYEGEATTPEGDEDTYQDQTAKDLDDLKNKVTEMEKEKKLREDIAKIDQKVRDIKNNYKDKDGNPILSDKQVDVILDMAYARNTDDLDTVAKDFVGLVSEINEKFLAQNEQSIIKKYLDGKIKLASNSVDLKNSNPPAPPAKKINSFDDATAAFARDLAEAMNE